MLRNLEDLVTKKCKYLFWKNQKMSLTPLTHKSLIKKQQIKVQQLEQSQQLPVKFHISTPHIIQEIHRLKKVQNLKDLKKCPHLIAQNQYSRILKKPGMGYYVSHVADQAHQILSIKSEQSQLQKQQSQKTKDKIRYSKFFRDQKKWKMNGRTQQMAHIEPLSVVCLKDSIKVLHKQLDPKAFITLTIETFPSLLCLKILLLKKGSAQTPIFRQIIMARTFILKTLNYQLNFQGLKTEWCAQFLKTINLVRLKVMSGIYSGLVAAVNRIFTKALMNIRKQTSFLIQMKQRARTECVLILFECKKNLDDKPLIWLQILIYFLMSLEIFTIIIKSQNKMRAKRTFGQLNLQTVAKVKVYTLLMIQTMQTLRKHLLSANTQRILYLQMDINLI